MNALDEDISDAIGLLGLLLVFVVGYFAAVIPSADELWGRPTPDVAYDRKTLGNRLRSLRNLIVGLAMLILSVLALTAPLAWRVVEKLGGGPYSVLRAGVLLVVAVLLAMLAACGLVARRVERRRQQLNN